MNGNVKEIMKMEDKLNVKELNHFQNVQSD